LIARAAPPRHLLNPTFVVACAVNFTAWATVYMVLATLALVAVRFGVPEGLAGAFPATASFCGLVAQLVAGRLQGKPWRLRLLHVPPLVFTGASLLMLAVPGPLTLFVACALFGLAYGSLQNTAIVLATESAPPERRGQAVGLYGTFTTLGVLVGPASGIEAFHRLGPSGVFLLTSVVSLVTFACALAAREPPRRVGPRPAGGERLHPLTYFAALALAGMTATWGTVITYLPLYAAALGLTNAGWYFAAQALAVMTLRAATGGLSDRFGRIQVLVPATAVVTLGIWGLALHPSVPALIALALLYGWGYAAIHPTTIALADDIATPATRGTALALVGSAFSVGAGAGALAMGYVLAHTSFEAMFFVAGWIPLIATGLCVWQWLAYPELHKRRG
jgi:MFS family permease